MTFLLKVNKVTLTRNRLLKTLMNDTSEFLPTGEKASRKRQVKTQMHKGEFHTWNSSYSSSKEIRSRHRKIASSNPKTSSHLKRMSNHSTSKVQKKLTLTWCCKMTDRRTSRGNGSQCQTSTVKYSTITSLLRLIDSKRILSRVRIKSRQWVLINKIFLDPRSS